ncbi:hypothetical protein SAMN03159448_01792 [Sinorhizobium sp. NFACC03]|nr:hypothetical protein SAMN03159448_01792 [Sinorhizobium sp. NFACC03]
MRHKCFATRSFFLEALDIQNHLFTFLKQLLHTTSPQQTLATNSMGVWNLISSWETTRLSAEADVLYNAARLPLG